MLTRMIHTRVMLRRHQVTEAIITHYVELLFKGVIYMYMIKPVNVDVTMCHLHCAVCCDVRGLWRGAHTRESAHCGRKSRRESHDQGGAA